MSAKENTLKRAARATGWTPHEVEEVLVFAAAMVDRALLRGDVERTVITRTIPGMLEALASEPTVVDGIAGELNYLRDHARTCAHSRTARTGNKEFCMDCGQLVGGIVNGGGK